MHQQGRKSANAIVAINTEAKRFEPDPGMPADQREIWLRVVAARPPEWFGEEHRAMLGSYCRHVAYGDRLAAALDKVRMTWLADPDRLPELQRLHSMHGRETAAALRLANAMRLTHQALDKIVTARKLQDFKPGAKPWQKTA